MIDDDCGQLLTVVHRKNQENTIKIRQNFKVKLTDSIIAAISQYLNIPLITSDDDFKRIFQPKIPIFAFI